MQKLMADGQSEDLIRSIVQMICAEGHYKTLVEKYNAQLENGLVDDLNATAEKLNDTINELNEVTDLRRTMMRRLFEEYEGDKDYHCLVKHLGASMYNAFEAYQASDDDPSLYEIYIKCNRRFIKALTQYLGFEPTECAACFADLLAGERKENING